MHQPYSTCGFLDNTPIGGGADSVKDIDLKFGMLK